MKRLWARAQQRQADAAEAGFDWPDLSGVIAKLHEEVDELADASAQVERDDARCTEELGDLLFVTAHLARRLGIDAETALAGALTRFDQRLAVVLDEGKETLPARDDPARLAVMESRWQAAKKRGL